MIDAGDRSPFDIERSALRAELERTNEEITLLVCQMRGGWAFGVRLGRGRVGVATRAGSGLFFLIYLIFLSGFFATGAALVLTDTAEELGVALVVGTIFAGGLFIAQVWALQLGKEHEVSQVLSQPARRALETLADRRAALRVQLNAMETSDHQTT